MKTPEEILKNYKPDSESNYSGKHGYLYIPEVTKLMEEYGNQFKLSQEQRPIDEEIERLFPCEIGQNVTMEDNMSYDETIKANYFRRQGAKIIINKFLKK